MTPSRSTKSRSRNQRTSVKGKAVFGFITVGVLAYACGPRPHGNDAVSLSTAARVRAPGATGALGARGAPSAPGAGDASPLASALDVQMKKGVTFAFHVTNTTSKKLELRFRSGQTHEVIVLDSAGREVWRWSNGRLFTQTLQNHVMRQSDSLSYDINWSDAPAGHYTAVATLASANFPVEQRREFTVR